MDKKTVKRLNKLNQEFYLKTQEYFNRTRQYYWTGWEKLLAYFPKQTLRVLDLGCGNGRWGEFLIKKGKKIDYIGLDNNQYLLNQAKKAVLQSELVNQDILDDWQVKGKFDLVTMFGVLHHVPSFENRIKTLKKAKAYLKKNGWLVFTLWQFKNIERLKKKIVTDHKIKNLENNDYILKWEKGVKALRYSHFVDEKELKKLLGELKMQLIEVFESDAKEGQGNKYVILKLAN